MLEVCVDWKDHRSSRVELIQEGYQVLENLCCSVNLSGLLPGIVLKV